MGSTGKAKREQESEGEPTSVTLQEGGQKALPRNVLPCVPRWQPNSPFRSAACVSGDSTPNTLDFFLRSAQPG